MPYPNEHAARIKDPGKYIRFRRQKGKFGPGIDVIFGVTKAGKTEVQAIRFKKTKFTVAQAKAWLKEHDYKAILFEPAAKADSTEQIRVGVCRFDTGTIRGTAGKTEEGYLKANAAVTRTGVFLYRRQDGTIVRELRHPDDVFTADSMDSLKMKPVTNLHPEIRTIDRDSASKFQVGFTGENIRSDAPYVMAPLVISDSQAISDVENGRKELSCGYICDLVDEEGVYQGQPYEIRQTNIRYNHVAVVDEGRAGPNVRINLDAADAVQVTTDTPKIKESNSRSKPHSRKERPMATYILDGIDYEADQEVINHIGKVEKDRADLTSKLDAAEKERDKATAERDQHKAKIDEFEKRDVKAEIETGVKARMDLERKAGKVLDEEAMKKIDSMSDEDIRKAVIQGVNKDVDLTDKSEAYIEARFDAAVESVKDADDTMAGQREQSATKEDTKDKYEDPVEKFKKDSLEAHKTKAA